MVLSVAATVDPSLVKGRDSRFVTACHILDEMMTYGNRIADFQRRELGQLDFSLRRLQEMSSASHQQVQHDTPESAASCTMTAADGQNHERDQSIPNVDTGSLLSEWNSDDSLNGEQLLALVDSLDYGQFDWPEIGDFDAWS